MISMDHMGYICIIRITRVHSLGIITCDSVMIHISFFLIGLVVALHESSSSSSFHPLDLVKPSKSEVSQCLFHTPLISILTQQQCNKYCY